jgi:hypothetical protein
MPAVIPPSSAIFAQYYGQIQSHSFANRIMMSTDIFAVSVFLPTLLLLLVTIRIDGILQIGYLRVADPFYPPILVIHITADKTRYFLSKAIEFFYRNLVAKSIS